MIPNFPLALSLALAPPGTAEIEGARWRELTQERAEIERVPELPGPYAAHRDVQVRAVEGGLEVRARWRVEALRPGWFSGRLLGTEVPAHVRSVRWNGRPAAVTTAREGSTIFGYATGGATIELVAMLETDPLRGPVALELLPAVVGRMRVGAPEGRVARVVEVAGEHPVAAVGAAFSTGSDRLAVEFAQAASEEQRDTLAVARTGIGLTVGEGELFGRAHVVWEVRRGRLDRVGLDTSGLPADLQVEGRNVRDWQRAGDRIDVTLQEPVGDRMDLTLRWRAAVPTGSEAAIPLPRVEPLEAFRSESSLQLARDGEVEVVPELQGWGAVASSALPEWGQGLVEGTPTAAFVSEGQRDGTLQLFRFVPVEGPPAVVDVAAYDVAASREGRLLVRARYEVRNERSAHLRVSPPAGMHIIGARVGQQAALPVRDGDDAWLIPLARSVETVEGLLSFPVEVALMGEDEEWARRDRRKLGLPALDAPVAVSRVTLHLPPGYRSRLEPGEGDVVGAFTEGEGITYGLGTGSVGTSEADVMFQSAVDAWLDNDFERAQTELDRLREIGASNDNIDKLQSNLSVVRGEKTGKKVDVSLERRIKEQARARASKDVAEQRKSKQKADELAKAGDYAAAKREYEAALEVGRRLEMLEQSEAVDQKLANVAVEKDLQDVTKASERQVARDRRFAESKRSSGSVHVEGQDLPPAKPEPAEDGISAPMYGTTGANITEPTQAAEGEEVHAEEAEAQVTVQMEAPGPAAREARRIARLPGLSFRSKSRARGAVGGGRSARTRSDTRAAHAPPPPLPPPSDDADEVRGRQRLQADAVGRLAALPPPTTHASALSVIIPAAGEVVLYQRLLLAQDATFEVDIEAREPLRERLNR